MPHVPWFLVLHSNCRWAWKRAHMASVIASVSVAINDSRRPYTVDCFEASASRNDILSFWTRSVKNLTMQEWWDVSLRSTWQWLVSLRASVASVAINRQGILMILASHTVDCFGQALTMTRCFASLNMTKGFSTESLPKDCVLGHSSKLIQVSSLNHCIP